MTLSHRRKVWGTQEESSYIRPKGEGHLLKLLIRNLK